MTTHSQATTIASTAGEAERDERKLKSLAGLLRKQSATRRAAVEGKFASEIYPIPQERVASYFAERHPDSPVWPAPATPTPVGPSIPPATPLPAPHSAPPLAGALAQARRWCFQLETDRAAEAYRFLMKRPQNLDSVIVELESLVPRMPGVWQLAELLGDAYLRANRLGLALWAYRRALQCLENLPRN